MDFSFHFDNKIDFIATLALILSVINSIAALISWYKQGPSLRLTATPGMIIIGAPTTDDNTYISFNISNVGTAVTTITNLSIRAYDSWFDYIFRNYTSLLLNNYSGPQAPFILPVGEKAYCSALQNEEFSSILSGKINYFDVWHSFSKTPTTVRIPRYKPYVRTGIR